MLGILPGRVVAIEHDLLVADHAGAAVGGGGVNAPRVHGCLGARDEEGAGLVQRVQPREVHVAAIHHVEGAGLQAEHVQHVHVVQLAVADVDEGGNGAAQVQQRVQLDGRLGGAKRRPVEQAQAQIDGAGVQRVDGVVQIDTERIVRVELARTPDQHGGQIGPDAPVARLVGVGQRGALDRRAKAHRVELGRVGRQARLDIAQALAPGELREGHRPELLGARQRACARVARVAMHDAREAGPRHELHDLSKQRLACVHAHSLRLSTPGSYAIVGSRSSNRHQKKSGCSPRQCLIAGSGRVI